MSTTLTQLRDTAFVRLYALVKIPLLAWVSPSVIAMDDEKTILQIKLGLRTKNHLGGMYFGALCMGAEASVAVKAIQTIRASGEKVDFVFKDFSAQFLKRAEGHVHFICDEGVAVRALVDKAVQSGERESETFHAIAIVPGLSNEPVAKFTVTLSLKHRK